jgi:hypothetical protein
MSNLQRPLCTLAYMRRHYPDAWQYRQEQITIILDDPPPPLAAMRNRLGREGAHEALEASIDAGTMKFVTYPGSAAFGIAFYCQSRDEYLVFGADGCLHRAEDVEWEPPEADDEP